MSVHTTSTPAAGQLAQAAPEQLLHDFARMAPDGFRPARALTLSPYAVQLEYSHADGRTHVLGLCLVTELVYRSETLPSPGQAAAVAP